MEQSEYIEKCSYSIDKKYKKLIIWHDSSIIDDISFKNHPHLLDDSGYCLDVMMAVSEESWNKMQENDRKHR